MTRALKAGLYLGCSSFLLGLAIWIFLAKSGQFNSATASPDLHDKIVAAIFMMAIGLFTAILCASELSHQRRRRLFDAEGWALEQRVIGHPNSGDIIRARASSADLAQDPLFRALIRAWAIEREANPFRERITLAIKRGVAQPTTFVFTRGSGQPATP